MKVIRKYAIRLLIFLLLLPLALIGLDAYLELGGVPDSYRAGILNQLAVEHGVLIDADGVKIGIINGLVLENVRLRDAQAPAVTLLDLPHLQVEIDRWELLDPAGWLQWPPQPRVQPTGFRLDGATLDLRPEDPALQDLRVTITDIHADVAFTPSQLQVRRFTGRVDGVHLDLQADIDRLYRLPPRAPPTPASTDTDSAASTTDSAAPAPPGPRSRAVSVQWLFQRVGPRLRQAIAEGRRVTASAQPDAYASAKLTLRVPAVGQPRVDFDISCQRYLYHGLALDQVAVAGHLTLDTLQVDTLRAEWDGGEYLHASGSYDLHSDTVQGAVTLLAQPDKLVKATYRRPIDSPLWPTFNAQPIFLHAEIAPSPLRRLEGWQVDLSVSGSDVAIARGTLRSFDAQLAYRGDLNLRLLRSTLEFGDETSGQASGILHLKTLEGWWHFVVDGDPRPASLLSADEQFHRHYQDLFRDFTFTAGARPHFDVILYRRRVDGDLRTIVDGDVQMRSITFRGVPVDSAAGRLQIDLLNRDIVVQDLLIQKAGHSARMQVHYHYHEGDSHDPADPSYLRFSGDSRLDTDTLLGLINPEWRQYPAMWDLRFATPPHISGSGYATLSGPDHVTLQVDLTATEITVGDTHISLPYGRITLQDAIWSASGGAHRIAHPDMVLHEPVFTQIRIPPRGPLSASGHAAAIQVDDLELLSARFDYRRDESRNHADLSALAVTRMAGDDPVVARDLRCPDLVWNHDQLSGHITASSYTASGQYSLADLDLQLSRDAQHRLHLDGSARDIRHIPTQAEVPSATFRAVQADGQLRLQVDSPRIRTLGAMTLEGVHASVIDDHGRYQADFTLDRFDWQTQYTAQQVSGSVSLDHGTVRWDARSRDLHTPHGRATGAHLVGTYDRGNWIVDHESDTLLYHDLPFTRASLKLLIQPDRLWIHDFSGDVFDGRVTGAVFANLKERNGRITMFGHDLSLKALRSARGGARMANADLSGTVNAHSSVDYHYAADRLLMEGDGSLTIRDGELYKVPVVSEFLTFMDALVVTRLFVSKDDARITELDATLKFQGDKLKVTDLSTNGAVVRLQGHGYYWWDTGGVDFQIQGKLLEKVFSLLPDVINPFDVLLAMRLRGSITDYEWSKTAPAWASSDAVPTDPMKPQK